MTTDFSRSSVHEVVLQIGNVTGKVGGNPHKAGAGVQRLLGHMDNVAAQVPGFFGGFQDAAGMANRRSRRAHLSADAKGSPEGKALRAALAQDADSLLRAFTLEFAAAVDRHDPNPYRTACDNAARHVQGLARKILNGSDPAFDARYRCLQYFAGARDAAFDPTAGGTAYPALIAQNFLREMMPLPKTHFEELFPNVSGEQPLMPGMVNYSVVRGTPAGSATEVSATHGDGWPTMTIGQQADLRGTCWLGIAIEDNVLARYQRAIPGAQAFGYNELFMAADLSLAAVQNKIEWFGNGTGGNMTGILNDPSLQPVAVARRASSTASDLVRVNSRTDDPDVVLDALIGTLREMNDRSVVVYDTVLISRKLAFDLVRQLKGSDGVTAESVGSFLKDKVFAVAMPGIKSIIADIWELDRIGSNGLTDAEMVANGTTQAAIDAMPNGMLFTTSGPFGIKRVPILPSLTLPEVDLGMRQIVYKLVQFGEPYISGLGQNKLLTMLG